MVSLARPDSF
jgi:hypothetical protein